MEISSLHEDVVSKLAESGVFGRGIDLFGRADSLLGLHRQGTTLRGWCCGSQMDAYWLSAVVRGGKVAGFRCNCPYDDGGICKHVVALLLRWCHMPEDFALVPPMEELMQRCTSQELAQMLEAAVERDPKFLAQLAPHEFTMPSFDEWDDDYDPDNDDDDDGEIRWFSARS